MPFFEGKVSESPRREFFYFSDNADLLAVRYNQVEDHVQDHCRQPVLRQRRFDQRSVGHQLRVDPWERYQSESTSYGQWWGEKLWVMMPATMVVAEFLATFEEYPPSQVSGSLSVDKALQALEARAEKLTA